MAGSSIDQGRRKGRNGRRSSPIRPRRGDPRIRGSRARPRVPVRWGLAFVVLLLPLSAGAQTSVDGVVHVVWDGAVDLGTEERAFFLVRPDGSSVLLQPGVDGDALAELDGSAVRVDGRATAAPGGGGFPVIRVEGVRGLGPGAAVRPAAVSADDFVTLLCRFSDDPSTPFTLQEIGRVHGPTYPGVAQFYQEHSQDPTTMSGNAVAGWYDLPSPRSSYVDGSTTQVGALARDCTAAADPDVDFRQFYGINLQVNGPLGTRSTPPYDVISLGGSWTLSLDGETRSFGMTWLSSEHAANYVVTTHEVGHGLGWPHSSGRYGEEYDSRWDVMSRGYLRFEDPFGWLTIHTIANHKRLAGWIPEERIWRPGVGMTETAVISRSALPPGDGFLMAEIPREDGTVYTIEARLEAGHDTPLPGEALVIHEVEGRRAYVVDPDLNGNPNDLGAQWTVGETFEDVARAIRVTVEERLADGFRVTIANQVVRTCLLEVGALPGEGGSARIESGDGSGPCGRAVSVAATPTAGWRFVEWTEGGESVSSANPLDFTLDSDRSLVATFEEQCRVQVSHTPEAGGTASVTAGGVDGACGRSVTVEATPNDGWAFQRWSEAGEELSTEPTYTFALNAGRSLVAEFQEICTITVAPVPEEGGTASVEEGVSQGPCGRTVVVTAAPASGWGFVRWVEGETEVSTESRLEVVPTADRDLLALFERQCAVALSVEPAQGGTVDVVDGNAAGPCGRTVTVTAAPADGWLFLEWTEGGQALGNTASLELDLGQDRAVEARFVAVEDLAARVMAHILEEDDPPSASERALLDRIGNGNGGLDVGDLLAFLDAHPDALGGGS